MVDVKHIGVRRHDFTLSDITFSVSPSSCHVVAGPTGCGKTVLLETIVGLISPESGSICVDGRDITSLPPEERGISYVPQDLAIFPHLTVRENVFYADRTGRRRDPSRRDRILDLADKIGIGTLWDRWPANLSGGEKQRVVLLRALASGNAILLLDEPFSALHEGLKAEMWELVRTLCSDFAVATVLVSHDIREIASLADSLTVMNNGRAIASGSPSDVLGRPRTLALARFAGVANLWPVELAEETTDGLSVGVPSLGLATVLEKPSGYRPGSRAYVAAWPSAVRPLPPGGTIDDDLVPIHAAVVRQYGLFSQQILVCETSSGHLVESNAPLNGHPIGPFHPGSNITLGVSRNHLFMVTEDE